MSTPSSSLNSKWWLWKPSWRPCLPDARADLVDLVARLQPVGQPRLRLEPEPGGDHLGEPQFVRKRHPLVEVLPAVPGTSNGSFRISARPPWMIRRISGRLQGNERAKAAAHIAGRRAHLDALIAQRRHPAQGAREVLREHFANGVRLGSRWAAPAAPRWSGSPPAAVSAPAASAVRPMNCLRVMFMACPFIDRSIRGGLTSPSPGDNPGSGYSLASGAIGDLHVRRNPRPAVCRPGAGKSRRG